MEKLSSKFANLGPPGIARRIAPPAPSEPKRKAETIKALAEATQKMADAASPAEGDKLRRWREKNRDLYLERQREYQRSYGARKKGEKHAGS